MATPYVAGISALVWSLNPDYTYKEVKSSVINGGDHINLLINKTSSGKAVNAYGALKYIQPPDGVTIIK